MLRAIGMMAGTAVLYQAMEVLGHAKDTQFAGPPNLQGARPGTKVVVLGAGLAGMLAAYELAKAGYDVQILEYNNRPGGRNWSLYGGDTYTELGGATQKVGFSEGNYLNPGPWRIPYHHRALLHYCKKFGVALEPFIQMNQQALVQSSKAFGGKPMRYRELHADWDGNVAELLAKAIDNRGLDSVMTRKTPIACASRCANGARWIRISSIPRTIVRRAGAVLNVRRAAACSASPSRLIPMPSRISLIPASGAPLPST